MKNLNIYIFFLILLLSVSCERKTDIELSYGKQYSSEPIFYFTSNNEEYKIEAGVNGFYQFAEYEVDSMNVYSFIARFAKLSTCAFQCEEELLIKIRDFQAVTPSTGFSIDESLNTGDYSFTNSQNLSLGDVMIVYTDKDGKTFQTDLVDLNATNYFRILAVSDFQRNENGQLTKKLDVAFNCTLIDPEDGSAINFEGAEGVIGVAYPE